MKGETGPAMFFRGHGLNCGVGREAALSLPNTPLRLASDPFLLPERRALWTSRRRPTAWRATEAGSAI